MKKRIENKEESIFPFSTETITEGSALLLVPKLEIYAKGKKEYIPSKAPVFYNPLMEFNRDLTILALKTYQKQVNHSLNICEPFTGCGVRGIRFAMEVPNITQIIVNDRNPQAIHLTRTNVKKNKLFQKITIKNTDTNFLLNSYALPKKRFDVIDLDPFGSPTTFIESALRATKNDGLLALTATDMPPLCGVKPLAGYRKYQGKPLRTEYCHELAVRLLLNSVVFAAVKNDLGIKVLFSHSTDHYIRVYVQIFLGVKQADESIKKLGYLTHCFHCLDRKWTKSVSEFPSLICNRCGDKMAFAGPLWMGALFDQNFCREIYNEARTINLRTKRRVLKLLDIIIKEADGRPTYFRIDKISKKLGLPGLSKSKLIQKLVEHGYQATETHFNTQGIRSNAPIHVIKRIAKLQFS